MDIDIKKVEKDGVMTVEIDGNLDTRTSPVLSDALSGQLANVKELILDLDKVSHISSAGVRVILATLQTMENQNGSMKLVKVNEVIVELLKNLGFLDLLTVEPK